MLKINLIIISQSVSNEKSFINNVDYFFSRCHNTSELEHAYNNCFHQYNTFDTFKHVHDSVTSSDYTYMISSYNAPNNNYVTYWYSITN